MYFDFAAFIRYNFRAFFQTRGQHYRLTFKRLLLLVIWLLLYIPAQIFNRIFFILDEIFYPRYRQQAVTKPVFIIGNPRSGTTFLHRLMYRDADSFTSFTVWELIFAPSITQRKLIWGLAKLAKAAGYPVRQLLERLQERAGRSKANKAHAVRLDEAEEDSYILIHSWTSEALWAIYPFRDEILPYFFFDHEIPENKRRSIMRFYRSMLQRHLYAHGGDKVLLSKNPSHSGKLASLLETFPDALFINLVRTPFEALPSMMDYMSEVWNVFCSPLERYPFKEEFFRVMGHYYMYPASFFSDKPERCYCIRYDDMVQHPDEIVEDLYSWLGLDYSDEYAELVSAETEKAHRYKSEHHYSIEEMGISEDQIFHAFEEVYSFYEFDTHQHELPERIFFWQINHLPQEWKRSRVERKERRRLLRQKGRQPHVNDAGLQTP